MEQVTTLTTLPTAASLSSCVGERRPKASPIGSSVTPCASRSYAVDLFEGRVVATPDDIAILESKLGMDYDVIDFQLGGSEDELSIASYNRYLLELDINMCVTASVVRL